MVTQVHTHCSYCMSLCGATVTTDGERVLKIEPDRDNPYTWRDFCRKGQTAGEMVEHPRRILTPMRRVGDRFVPATYGDAINEISAEMLRITEKSGKDAVACYQGNPLTFDFGNSVFLGGLLDAIGTGNRYWIGSIDQNASHVVSEEMYGTPVISFTADVDNVECFLLLGMDPAVSKFGWVESLPDGWHRTLAAVAKGADLIVVDPRRSRTADHATLHLAITPGQDWAFLLGVIKTIIDNDWDTTPTAVELAGVDTLRALVAGVETADLATRCGISESAIRDVAERFARSRSAVCIAHTGVVLNSAGTLGEWLSQVLNAITDRLDTPGGKHYERGYIDVPKAWDMMSPPTKHRSRLLDLPTIAGFHAMAELTDEIMTPGAGQIRALMMVAGNPVVSGPDGAALDAALTTLDLLVVVDVVQRESHRHADWLIPGTHWLEREGIHPAMGSATERPFAQYARRAVETPPGVRQEWEFFLDLALAMRRPFFGYRGLNSLVRVSRRIARLTRLPRLGFGPHWVEAALVASGRRIRLRDIKKQPHGWAYGEKEFGALAEALRTSDGRVQCAPPSFVAELERKLAEAPSQVPDGQFPFRLTNRRSREAMNSWLNDLPGTFSMHRSNPLEVHPDDASALGLVSGDWARVTSRTGTIDVPVVVSPNTSPGLVTLPHGWGGRIFDPSGEEVPLAHGVNRNLLVDRNVFDPLSQTTALSDVRVRVEAVVAPDLDTSSAGELLQLRGTP